MKPWSVRISPARSPLDSRYCPKTVFPFRKTQYLRYRIPKCQNYVPCPAQAQKQHRRTFESHLAPDSSTRVSAGPPFHQKSIGVLRSRGILHHHSGTAKPSKFHLFPLKHSTGLMYLNVRKKHLRLYLALTPVKILAGKTSLISV